MADKLILYLMRALSKCIHTEIKCFDFARIMESPPHNFLCIRAELIKTKTLRLKRAKATKPGLKRYASTVLSSGWGEVPLYLHIYSPISPSNPALALHCFTSVLLHLIYILHFLFGRRLHPQRLSSEAVYNKNNQYWSKYTISKVAQPHFYHDY